MFTYGSKIKDELDHLSLILKQKLTTLQLEIEKTSEQQVELDQMVNKYVDSVKKDQDDK